MIETLQLAVGLPVSHLVRARPLLRGAITLQLTRLEAFPLGDPYQTCFEHRQRRIGSTMQYTSEYNTPVQGCLGVYLDVASTQQGSQMPAGTGLQVWVPWDESDARQLDALRLSSRRDHLDLHATDNGRDPPAKVSRSERCAAKECDETDQKQDWGTFQGLREGDGHRSFNPLTWFRIYDPPY
jgi:hypothetical protein